MAIGITKIEKEFAFGDVVAIICNNEVVARGLTNYSHDALKLIKGKQSHEISKILGHKDYDEVIHRDNMALIKEKDD